MSGTKAGGIKAAQKNKELYGKDFYARIGAKGGEKGTDGGFKYAQKHYDPDDPRHPSGAGRKGGKLSKR